MPPREIPGFYYDEEKNKYFKIESRATAPSTAAWSAENVKKRAQKDLERERREPKRGRLARCQPIRPSPTAAGHCFAGARLRLECEGLGRLEEKGRALEDARAMVWAEGLGDAGTVLLGGFDGYKTRITDFEVVTGDVERLGYVYVAAQSSMGRILFGKYVPTDHYGRICFDAEETGIKNYPINMPGDWTIPSQSLSALGYNPHKKVFFASCMPGRDGPRTPLLCLGRADPLRPGPTVRSRLHFDHGLRPTPTRPISAVAETYAIVSAPSNSPALGYLGTSSGAVQVRDTGEWDTLKPTRRHGAIFAVDCSHLDPDLVVAGGRQGTISTTDTRTGELAASFMHGTTATHLRIAPEGDGDEHRVLVAGVRNTMAIYDRRWLGRRSHKAPAVVTFPEYRNEARVRIGWDVCPESGVVVAAEGTGAVGLYSLASGRRVGELPLGSRASEEDPVGCLRVARLGGDAMPSVFVAVETGVAKFSWRVTDDDDRRCEMYRIGRWRWI